MSKKLFSLTLLLTVFLIFPQNLYAKAICKVPVFYKWKVDDSYKDANMANANLAANVKVKLNKAKQANDKIRETFWGVIVADGEKKEDAEKNLNYMILEKQGDILSLCKREHESYSNCIASKYKKLQSYLESSNFSVRRQIEDSIKLDCENQVGDCLGILKKDILCEEIKEVAVEEEVEETKDKKGKKDKKGADKKAEKKK